MNKQIEDMAYLIYKNRPIMEMWVDKADAIAEMLYKNGYRKQSDTMAFCAIDAFRDALMDAFLHLCNWNDYNKLTLLKIGDTVDEVYDKCIADMVSKIKGESDEQAD